MSIGAGIALFVIGAILAFAVEGRQVGPVDVEQLGYILMLAGLLVAVLSFVLASRARRHDTVAVTRDSAGRESVTERRTEGGPVDPRI